MVIGGDILYDLCRYFQYPLEAKKPVIFAVRGCLPEAAFGGHFNAITSFQQLQSVKPVRPDYRTPRCTVGLWCPQQNEIAVFPGSTLPSRSYLFSCPSALATFNILCPGRYELRRGIHPRIPDRQNHTALLMDGYGLVKIPEVKKLKNTVSFSATHYQYKVLLPGDNLHAARTEPANACCTDMLQLPYSSSGCITVAGQAPDFVQNGTPDAEWNCWQKFMKALNERSATVTHFSFLLFNFLDLRLPARARHRQLRYGSEGKAVAGVQQALGRIINGATGAPYYSSTVTGRFDEHLATAYLRFQQDFSRRKLLPQIIPEQFFSCIPHFYSP